MIRVLKSGAMLSYYRTAKSVLKQWWPLIYEIKVQPGVLSPISELLASKMLGDPSKFPVWSWIK
jgi:hypothetical protein